MAARMGLEPASLEDKIVRAHEKIHPGLAPWEIAEIAQKALSRLPTSLRTGDVDLLFDVFYNAISEGVEKAQNS